LCLGYEAQPTLALVVLLEARKMKAMAVRCDGLVHIYRSAATEVVALRDVDLAVEEYGG
jgi:hypothetical protein